MIQGFSSGDPAGIRTPDTLLKRQVLCRLSYWVVFRCQKKMAGVAGFEPTDAGVKVPCLTAWRHPIIWPFQSCCYEERAGGPPTLSPLFWGG